MRKPQIISASRLSTDEQFQQQLLTTITDD